VLELFARSGKPPQLHEISEETELAEENLRTFIAELETHDLLGSGPSADVVRYAYPFTGDQTGHHIQLRGRKLHAVMRSMRSASPQCLVRTSSLSLHAGCVVAVSKLAPPKAENH
jgi:hypothetical protein